MLCILVLKVLNLVLLDVSNVYKQANVYFYFHCIYAISLHMFIRYIHEFVCNEEFINIEDVVFINKFI